MSNGRLWMVCRKCGEMRLLSKYWGHSWAWKHSDLDAWDEWFTEHAPDGPTALAIRGDHSGMWFVESTQKWYCSEFMGPTSCGGAPLDRYTDRAEKGGE